MVPSIRCHMLLRRISILAFLAMPIAAPVTAQEAVSFGDWRAFCAPMAGCVLGVKSRDGDTLAFVEPPSGDDRMLVFLKEPARNGADIILSLDGRVVVTLGPADGWRRIDSPLGSAIQIAPSVVREGLWKPMQRRNRIVLKYPTDQGTDREIGFSLNGYADTRGYAEDE